MIQEYRPHVIVCLRSQVQDDRYEIKSYTREIETGMALCELLAPPDVTDRFPWRDWSQWPYLDRNPSWPQLLRALEILDAGAAFPYDPVFAPAVEPDGHEQHNRIGELAVQVFGDRVIPYLTYTRSGGRSRGGTEIEPKPDWIVRKHRALACYRSQIAEPSCRPWFTGDIAEYVA